MSDLRRFIVWDPSDGVATLDSSGLIGRVGIDNAYIRCYPKWLDGKTADDLAIGEHARAQFSLSGSSGFYQVVRVTDREES